MNSPTTSLQRTYRYLRIGLGGVSIVIAASVCVAAVHVGVLSSISAYFYTTARHAFVGALIAASLALFAISGRGPSRVFLDAAGLVAPIIALVPTPVRSGTIRDLNDGCAVGTSCVPEFVRADVANGVYTYVIVGALVWLVLLILRIRGNINFQYATISFATAAAVLAAVFCVFTYVPEIFLRYAHGTAAVLFFLLIGATAVANVLSPPENPPPRGLFKTLYLLIAVGFVIDLIVASYFAFSDAPTPAPFFPVLICEAIALALFLLFWILQTIQKWDQLDPTI